MPFLSSLLRWTNAITRAAAANVVETADRVRALLPKLKR
jgi:hypothetical protein